MEHYGRQGWWPLKSRAGEAGFDARGYHPGIYHRPETQAERFEVALGAVLTQNTTWQNAEKALDRLIAVGMTAPDRITACRLDRLGALIRSSGYYNQKALKLKYLAGYFCNWSTSREALLELWGIGPETADSILLYAFLQPVFVVDRYTCRLVRRLFDDAPGNRDIRARFMETLPADPVMFNEYHALIVHHAKLHCRITPLCAGCPLFGFPCKQRERG
ncbi:MAG TPA: hypothetical protein ENI27_09175 [bacterium]|nr:hypothetical protein [bacterium]